MLDGIRLWQRREEYSAQTYASRRSRITSRLDALIADDRASKNASRLVKRVRSYENLKVELLEGQSGDWRDYRGPLAKRRKKDKNQPSRWSGKVLACTDPTLSAREVIEWYEIRRQIEVFFKELKSTLGFHQYQNFEAVEAWVELALATLLYLEWYRARQLARRGLSEREKEWWRRQRTHGPCQAMRQASQQAELKYIADRLETPGGIRKLRSLIRNSLAPEYQATA